MHHDQTKSLPSKSFCFIFHICILVQPRTCIITINKNLTVLKGSLQEIHLLTAKRLPQVDSINLKPSASMTKKVIGISKFKVSYWSWSLKLFWVLGLYTCGSPSAVRLMYLLQASFEDIFTVKNEGIQEIRSFCHFSSFFCKA